jgi:hypothetical protein
MLPPDTKTFELIARELGTEEAFVEKDWQVKVVWAFVDGLAYSETLIN